jgi:DNA-binding XRE family transcriptional regulator
MSNISTVRVHGSSKDRTNGDMNDCKRIRLMLEYSQSTMADMLGVSVATISRIEKGTPPHLYVLAMEGVMHRRKDVQMNIAGWSGSDHSDIGS